MNIKDLEKTINNINTDILNYLSDDFIENEGCPDLVMEYNGWACNINFLGICIWSSEAEGYQYYSDEEGGDLYNQEDFEKYIRKLLTKYLKYLQQITMISL